MKNNNIIHFYLALSQRNTFISKSYDYIGRRFEKTVIVEGNIEGSQKFVYNDYLQIGELNSHNESVKSYLWDPIAEDASRPLMLTDHQLEQSFFFTHDANKNVVDLIDEDGIVAVHYEYSPFGAITLNTNPIFDNKFSFSSEYLDPELGLICYNYRHYNPMDGRWISRDPIEEEGGYNLYGMVGNNSLCNIDSNGQWVINIGFTVNLSIFAAGTLSLGVAVGYSRKEGVTVGGYYNIGGGVGGLAGGVGVNIGITPSATQVSDLSGISVGMGISGGEVLVIGVGISAPPIDDICYGLVNYNLFVGGGGGLPIDGQVTANGTYAIDFCLINGETIHESGDISLNIPIEKNEIK